MANVNFEKKKGAAAVEEALNALRGSVMLRFPEAKAVCLVGERPYADKLRLALGLAERFAALEKKTLFVECAAVDRPAPGAWKAEGPALADYLAGKADLAQVVRKVSPWLDVIPTGAAANISELIASDRLDALLAEVREQYDYIILDATAMADCSDAAMAARCCDGALLLVEYHGTRDDALTNARDALQRDGIRLLGIVAVKPEKTAGYIGQAIRTLLGKR